MDCKTGEKSQLNNLCLTRIREFKFLERLVNCKKIEIAFGAKIESFIQRQSDSRWPASFVAPACDSIADQNPPHGPCRERNDMRFVFPGMVRALKDAQKSFVQERCWLQGMTRALARQIFRCKAA
jgi:hypothetical protein